MVFLIRLIAIKTTESTRKEPKLEASVILKLVRTKDPKTVPKKVDPKIKVATPKLAPELIHNTKGPANGFLNNVCINRPLTPKPEPTSIAVIAFGIL